MKYAIRNSISPKLSKQAKQQRETREKQILKIYNKPFNKQNISRKALRNLKSETQTKHQIIKIKPIFDTSTQLILQKQWCTLNKLLFTALYKPQFYKVAQNKWKKIKSRLHLIQNSNIKTMSDQLSIAIYNLQICVSSEKFELHEVAIKIIYKILKLTGHSPIIIQSSIKQSILLILPQTQSKQNIFQELLDSIMFPKKCKEFQKLCRQKDLDISSLHNSDISDLHDSDILSDSDPFHQKCGRSIGYQQNNTKYTNRNFLRTKNNFILSQEERKSKNVNKLHSQKIMILQGTSSRRRFVREFQRLNEFQKQFAKPILLNLEQFVNDYPLHNPINVHTIQQHLNTISKCLPNTDFDDLQIQFTQQFLKLICKNNRFSVLEYLEGIELIFKYISTHTDLQVHTLSFKNRNVVGLSSTNHFSLNILGQSLEWVAECENYKLFKRMMNNYTKQIEQKNWMLDDKKFIKDLIGRQEIQICDQMHHFRKVLQSLLAQTSNISQHFNRIFD